MHVGVSVSLLFFKWLTFSKSILLDGQLEVKRARFNLLHGYPPQLSQGLSAYHLSPVKPTHSQQHTHTQAHTRRNLCKYTVST